MTYYKSIISILVSFIFLISIANSYVLNDGGDFEVILNSQKDKVLNDNINSIFQFQIKNNEDFSQKIELIVPEVNGWTVKISADEFNLDSGEIQNLTMTLSANSDFDYETSVVGPNEFKITQKKDYKGFFTFPIEIIGTSEKVSLNFEVEIESPNKPLSYEAQFASKQISPILDLKYSITGKNIDKYQSVDILVEINGEKVSEFEETFSKENSYKIYSNKISSKFSPGNYPVKITIRYFDENKASATEWYSEEILEVVKFDQLSIESSIDSSILDDKYTFKIKNVGNVDSIYLKKLNVSFLESFFFSTQYDYIESSDLVIFQIPVKKGESTELTYSYNYTYLYLFLLLLIIFVAFVYHRENAVPISVETKLYSVKRDNHEGVKSFKVRLGFESIKDEELEDIKLVFKMPSYLAVKEGSFLLSEPNQVLKGKHQYKLVWNFHNFEKADSRILGFTLENKRGILGDIKVEDLEFEIKINGKIKTYKFALPTIKG